TTTMGKRRDEIFPKRNELECLSMPPPLAVCGLDIVDAFEPREQERERWVRCLERERERARETEEGENEDDISSTNQDSNSGFYSYKIMSWGGSGARLKEAVVSKMEWVKCIWNDLWIGDSCFRYKFPRLYALDINKECTVADKMVASFTSSFRREVRGGAESLQLTQILDLLGTVILSNMEDRWIWDLNGDGEFCVKDVRNLLDATFLPKADSPTRWIQLRSHTFSLQMVEFGLDSYIYWPSWIKALRMNSKSKSVLEGVFYTLVEYLEL
ncbi:hypothetical protein Tco_0654621, partial [Tanacetum coccineum]